MLNVKSEPLLAAKSAAPPAEYSADDVKAALETSEKALHEAVFIAREVWETDAEALPFEIDDLVEIESALQEICCLLAGIPCEEA